VAGERATITFLDALVEALRRAGSYNRNDQEPPAAVLWPDKERQWVPLLPLLRARLPLLTLGDYHPGERSGPAFWLRCMIARSIPDDRLPDDATPILYLPGYSRQELRAIEDCPRPLKPLAELQYRGTIWTHRNGKDWTVSSFLQSANPGLGIELGGDSATREALQRALLRIAEEPVARLRKEAPLRAQFFDSLLNPDEARSILLWLNDPAHYRERLSSAEWDAFVGLCARKYGVDPAKDGPLAAAERLGRQEPPWELIWQRFRESPQAYPQLPELLRRARPAQLTMFDLAEAWPQDNETAETQLRIELQAQRERHPNEVRETLARLEAEHAPRRDWVWAALGRAPLAAALEPLSRLAAATRRIPAGASVAAIAAAYAEWGWEADAAVLDALATVEDPGDVAAVKSVITALYRPWLTQAATTFQQALVGAQEATSTAVEPIQPAAGVCVLFCDALRFDLGRALAAALSRRGLSSTLTTRLAALPTVTATAKPALAPLNGQLSGAGQGGLEPAITATGARLTIDGLRRALEGQGYQILRGNETGDPSGRAWAELGAIDSYGHQHGWKLAHHVRAELRALERRVAALLDAGWQQVQVITDHGWLMLPDGLPKAELPEHLTVVRKGRCARLKELAQTDQQVVSWYWDPSARIAVAPNICCYEAGKEYEHGGLSPQECVVPVINVTRGGAIRRDVVIERVAWRGLRCVIKVAGAQPGDRIDLRGRAADPGSSLTAEAKAPGPDGSVSLIVPDDEREGEDALVVVLATDGNVLAQTATVIGG